MPQKKRFCIVQVFVYLAIFCAAIPVIGANSTSYNKAKEFLSKKQHKESFEICLPQAKLNDAACQNLVGWFYQRGLVVEKNMAEAIGWYEKSMSSGFSKAQVNLGRIYLDQRNTKIYNEAKGIELLTNGYLESINNNDLKQASNLSYFLGNYYKNNSDLDKAEEWFQKSASAGNKKATIELNNKDEHVDEQTMTELAGIIGPKSQQLVAQVKELKEDMSCIEVKALYPALQESCEGSPKKKMFQNFMLTDDDGMIFGYQFDWGQDKLKTAYVYLNPKYSNSSAFHSTALRLLTEKWGEPSEQMDGKYIWNINQEGLKRFIYYKKFGGNAPAIYTEFGMIIL